MAGQRVVIMGAAGRDFHNFNVFFRNNKDYSVVAFTATQIPDIENKTYPPALAGNLYPEGIPILPEEDLIRILNERAVNVVVFAYSDVSHEYVMHKASSVVAAGADFWLMGPKSTMLKSSKPVISICATRTGCGKSQTTRKIAGILKAAGKRVVVVRHPMPYGDLERQAVQRFASMEDMRKQNCTIEEMEEYEPHIKVGSVVFAGVDYESILKKAEEEADVILWDGGNNDYPFYVPDLEIVVDDPHRPDDDLKFYPGEVNLKRAHIVVINKIDTAKPEDVLKVREHVRGVNPGAVIIEAESPLTLQGAERINGSRVLVIEDGPTLTHGGMRYGIGVIAAQKYGAKEIIDPRPYARGKIAETFKRYPDIGALLPAMGYDQEQLNDLEATIDAVECDLVIIGTPVDLTRIINITKPSVKVEYELREKGKPDLQTVLAPFME